MDEQKVQVVLSRSVPSTVRVVRAFLGLIGHYRRLIRNYGAITSPLTKLLCKGIFQWSTVAKEAFCALQQGLTTMSVLQLLTFDKEFMV
jgi:hypothetical protein